MGIALESGFNLWVFCVLNEWDVTILLVKHQNIKYLNKNHKTGLPLPNSMDDVAKKNIYVALHVLEDSKNVPHKIPVEYQIIFDIKLKISIASRTRWPGDMWLIFQSHSSMQMP